jgi:hypothetical protein
MVNILFLVPWDQQLNRLSDFCEIRYGSYLENFVLHAGG